MKILLGSYGHFASGIKSSLEMLLERTDHITVIDSCNEATEFEQKMDEYFQGISENEQLVMLSDHNLGWINPIMYMYLERPNTFLIAGANLTLVLQLALQTEPIDKTMLNEIVEDSRKAMRILKFESTTYISTATNNNN